MFARVTIVQGSPERYDQTVRYVQEQLIPKLKQTPGIKAAYVLGDRQTGKGISITLWETEEAMNAGTQALNQTREQAAADTNTASTDTQGYEVIAQF